MPPFPHLDPGGDLPLSIEPIVGWRVWGLERVGDRLTLMSVTQSARWPAGQVMRARCPRGPHRGSKVPSDRCSCGLYAASSPEYLATAGAFGRATCVVGAIAMWGKVIEHRRGARSELAYPARLRLVCAPCLAAQRGAVDPVAVVGSTTLIAVCHRHLADHDGPSVPAAGIQTELLDTYSVELIPRERVARTLRRSIIERPVTPQALFLGLFTLALKIIQFAIGAVIAMVIIGGVVGFIGSAIDTVFGRTAGTSSSTPPDPSPATRSDVLLDPRALAGPVHVPPVHAPPAIAFVCGLGHGQTVELVDCSRRGVLIGFAERSIPGGADEDCVSDWTAYSRGPDYWVCWTDVFDRANVRPWARTTDPFNKEVVKHEHR